MAEELLQRIRIVLVEPAGPLNVGSVARVMKNMGLSRLVLVNPLCDPLGPEARQMAVHAADILESALQVANLPQALAGCHRSIATTGRDRALPTELQTPRTGLPWLLADPGLAIESALIFGPEDRGLSNEELKHAQRFLKIPSSALYPSLNLAQAVAVCAYELYQLAIQSETIDESPSAVTSDPEAPLEAMEQSYSQLEALLLKIGYLYPHTAQSRMEKFRRVFNRAALSKGELAMLRGVLSQVQWALTQKSDD